MGRNCWNRCVPPYRPGLIAEIPFPAAPCTGAGKRLTIVSPSLHAVGCHICISSGVIEDVILEQSQVAFTSSNWTRCSRLALRTRGSRRTDGSLQMIPLRLQAEPQLYNDTAGTAYRSVTYSIRTIFVRNAESRSSAVLLSSSSSQPVLYEGRPELGSSNATLLLLLAWPLGGTQQAVVDLSVSLPQTAVQLQPRRVLFTSANASKPVVVQLAVLDDRTSYQNASVAVTATVTAGLQPLPAGVSRSSTMLQPVVDNDREGLWLSHNELVVNETGTQATLRVWLTSRPQRQPVVLEVRSTDSSEVEVRSGATLVRDRAVTVVAGTWEWLCTRERGRRGKRVSVGIELMQGRRENRSSRWTTGSRNRRWWWPGCRTNCWMATAARRWSCASPSCVPARPSTWPWMAPPAGRW